MVELSEAMQVTPQQQNMDIPLMQARELTSGFHVTGRPLAPEPAESEYEIIGSEYSQIVEITLQPGEVVTAEPGTMMYMTSGMGMNTDMGGLGQGLKRCCCAGESMFRLHLENKTPSLQRVAVSPAFPAKIQPVDLRRHTGMVFNRGAFLAALGKDWHVDLKSVRSVGTCCFGGQGLFMNTLHGDGIVFLNAGGTVMTKTLAHGEELLVDHNTVLAFEKTVHLDIRRVGGLMTCCCGGQGLFNSVLRGPGFVMMHTMPLAKLRKSVGGNPEMQRSNSGGGA